MNLVQRKKKTNLVKLLLISQESDTIYRQLTFCSFNIFLISSICKNFKSVCIKQIRIFHYTLYWNLTSNLFIHTCLKYYLNFPLSIMFVHKYFHNHFMVQIFSYISRFFFFVKQYWFLSLSAPFSFLWIITWYILRNIDLFYKVTYIQYFYILSFCSIKLSARPDI